MDFVVAVDDSTYPALVAAARAHGFVRATAVGASEGKVPDLELFRDASGRRIDFLYAHTDFELSALSRAEIREPYGTPVRVASPEDLIVYKLLAGRAQDRLDILAMLSALALGGSRTIDWSYVERWCREWDALPALERLRAELAEP